MCEEKKSYSSWELYFPVFIHGNADSAFILKACFKFLQYIFRNAATSADLQLFWPFRYQNIQLIQDITAITFVFCNFYDF